MAPVLPKVERIKTPTLPGEGIAKVNKFSFGRDYLPVQLVDRVNVPRSSFLVDGHLYIPEGQKAGERARFHRSLILFKNYREAGNQEFLERQSQRFSEFGIRSFYSLDYFSPEQSPLSFKERVIEGLRSVGQFLMDGIRSFVKGAISPAPETFMIFSFLLFRRTQAVFKFDGSPFEVEADPPKYSGHFSSKVPGRLMEILEIPSSATFKSEPQDLHITIVGAAETKGMLMQYRYEGLSKRQARRKVNQKLKQAVAEVEAEGGLGNPIVVGQGKAGYPDGPNTVYYAAVRWPGAQKVREKLGLNKRGEKDFFIVLGSTSTKHGKPADAQGTERKANFVRFERPKSEIEMVHRDFSTLEEYEWEVFHLKQHRGEPKTLSIKLDVGETSRGYKNGLIGVHESGHTYKNEIRTVGMVGGKEFIVTTKAVSKQHDNMFPNSPSDEVGYILMAGSGKDYAEIIIRTTNRKNVAKIHSDFTKVYHARRKAKSAMVWLTTKSDWAKDNPNLFQDVIKFNSERVGVDQKISKKGRKKK